MILILSSEVSGMWMIPHEICVSEQGSKEIPDEVLKDAAGVTPSQAAVCLLVQMEVLLSPARYLSTYHSPVHELLDSGNPHILTSSHCSSALLHM